MEFLLYLSPMFEALCWICGFVVLGGTAASIIFYTSYTEIVYDENPSTKSLEEQYYKNSKFFAKVAVVCAVLFILSTPLASIGSTYKSVLLYKGITSENVEKIADSTTRIIEMAEKYVEQKVKKETK